MNIFPQTIETYASSIILKASREGAMLATAASCTGGLIAAALTEIPGSSAVVDRGFVTYTNRAKVELLGVSEDVLSAYGAVSRETALQMVAGALMRSRATVAVAVTGIAGPGGGSAEKPVGLVHLAARHKDGRLLHREMRYGDLGRDGIRLATVETALEMVESLLG